MWEKLKKIVFSDNDNSIPEMHTICTECNGYGAEDFFINCKKCEGKGITRMTYQEYVDSLPPLE
jgi:DnaJ-class molecular chaperone